MKKIIISMLATTLFLLSSCQGDEEEVLDTEYPVIDTSFAGAFPVQCSTVKRGETFTFRVRLRDNLRLGSLSVDIHHNFDHHTHSTEVTECAMEPVKAPVKPFLLIKDFPIPEGQREYEGNYQIQIPADVDPGDYHFLIRLTDQEGWQTLKGLSIKVQ
ncbi:DUF4625 domain-containing protein [Rufibacter immobilis]|uniref:DUF4625 domain-containing protein n=1 Tax=Rufibacter immobilis TaxID=1348778 RepID=A0A3M9MTF4_9BACT|nr:DUF4625 domain-containing protein [Rufibacter immobilis]RNI28475.1 DUF4625 domain-containing protein [Rufibacter immobilis]